MVLYNFITNLILNVKYTKLIKKVYKDEDLLNKFSQLFGTEFRIDWVGRIYTVINPTIIDDKFDINTQIFEYGEEGLTNNVYIERWIMSKFNLVKDFIIANNLFDLLTYRIEKIDDYENYLFVIEPITFEDCKKWTKIFTITYSVIAATIIILSQFINFTV
jgi:hypothetical protein